MQSFGRWSPMSAARCLECWDQWLSGSWNKSKELKKLNRVRAKSTTVYIERPSRPFNRGSVLHGCTRRRCAVLTRCYTRHRTSATALLREEQQPSVCLCHETNETKASLLAAMLSEAAQATAAAEEAAREACKESAVDKMKSEAAAASAKAAIESAVSAQLAAAAAAKAVASAKGWAIIGCERGCRFRRAWRPADQGGRQRGGASVSSS